MGDLCRWPQPSPATSSQVVTSRQDRLATRRASYGVGGGGSIAAGSTGDCVRRPQAVRQNARAVHDRATTAPQRGFSFDCTGSPAGTNSDADQGHARASLVLVRRCCFYFSWLVRWRRHAPAAAGRPAAMGVISMSHGGRVIDSTSSCEAHRFMWHSLQLVADL
nr:uncharacterized protein LOC127308584 [Lolium perenne]